MKKYKDIEKTTTRRLLDILVWLDINRQLFVLPRHEYNLFARTCRHTPELENPNLQKLL
jgi:hypothetical protein